MADDDKEASESESDVDEEMETGEEEEGKRRERYVCDQSAYHMLHEAQTGAPCLSFDIIPDSLGAGRVDYPHTLYLVAGTQAEKSHQNNIVLTKQSNLHRTTKEPAKKDGGDSESDDSESDSDEDETKAPNMETVSIRHFGGVNRIRTTNVNSKQIAATWSDTGHVYLWDITRNMVQLDHPDPKTKHQKNVKPVYNFSGHQTEGFAMDWSRITPGKLATGDCKKFIHVWTPTEAGTWHVDQRPLAAHTKSVEDLQWSPTEDNVLASCSVDMTIKIWDCRAAPKKACMLSTKAHDADVNVIHWNHNEPFIVSGGDDGVLKVWDLRQFKDGESVAVFKFHTGPITSVEWCDTDATVFVSSGADDQITVWDLSVEKDSSTAAGREDPETPPQLLFIHKGQREIKETHWHPQIPGLLISTAADGMNIFKTISV